MRPKRHPPWERGWMPACLKQRYTTSTRSVSRWFHESWSPCPSAWRQRAQPSPFARKVSASVTIQDLLYGLKGVASISNDQRSAPCFSGAVNSPPLSRTSACSPPMAQFGHIPQTGLDKVQEFASVRKPLGSAENALTHQPLRSWLKNSS